MLAKLLHLPRLPLLLWLGWSLAPVIEFVKTYVFDDVGFVLTFCVVVGVDTVLGVWRGLSERSLSSRAFGQLFQKVCFYALFLIAAHAAARHKVNGEVNTLLTWLDSVAYSLVMVRELLSILENATALRLFIAPRWLVARLERFHDAGPDADATHSPDAR